ncbi:MAG: sugar transferase [Idiomarina sp.]|nr:sugar transferase [Idiomarina sp.]
MIKSVLSQMTKRLMDITSSFVALVIFSPLFLLLSMAIRFDSKGPILFAQKRVGQDEKIFRIYKFRTMVDRDADSIDQMNEKVVSSNDDPRITRMGKFLRNSSLDELPQLLNIFLGHMSIVGPRPIIPEQLIAIPPAYRKRAAVAPGLTGLSQIRGRRNLSWLLQLAYDAEYVEKRTLWLDLKIIFNTAWQVIRRQNIYGTPGMNWRGYLAQLDGSPPQDIHVREALSDTQQLNADNHAGKGLK